MIDTLLLRQDIAQLIEELHTTSNLSLEQIQFYIKKGDNETEYTFRDLWPIFARNNDKIKILTLNVDIELIRKNLDGHDLTNENSGQRKQHQH